MIITIDGPTASGKSSIAVQLASSLDYIYLNTGLLYRALAFILIEHYHYTRDLLENPRKRDIAAVLSKDCFFYYYDKQRGSLIFYKEQDITAHLKSPQVDEASSLVSADPIVREALLGVQRSLGEEHKLVAEGRDCGSIIFPDAQYKFFITASLAIRAERWVAEQRQRGVIISLKKARLFIQERDTRDSARTIAPLVIPRGAIVVDTSWLTIEEAVRLIMSFIDKQALV